MKKGIEFSLAKINSNQFSTLEVQIDDESQIDILANIDFGIDPAKNRVKCLSKFEFQYQSQPFIIISADCEFQLSATTWSSLVKASGIELPKGFLQHLAVLTIGTVRGILHAKTENTDYNRFYLPTLDITGLIDGDLTIPLG